MGETPRTRLPEGREKRARTANAITNGALLLPCIGLLCWTSMASANEPLAITLRQDSSDSGPSEPIKHFGALGEPIHVGDWLCVETPSDLGEALVIDLRDVSVTGDEGQRVGRFVSASGNIHSFRAFHRNTRDGRLYQYCAHIRPHEWATDTIRFVDESDTHRLAWLEFAWNGDTSGCASKSGEPVGCGTLTPSVGGFAYGSTAMSYWWLGLSRAQSSYFGESTGALGLGITRLRLSAYLPLLYLSVGSTKTLALSTEAGVALPWTIASTTSLTGGSLMGLGIGPYAAECVVLRSVIAPRICGGVELDGVLEGSMKAGPLDELAPHAVASWFLSFGLGSH